jgi:NTP pyrophosphatase (non-canonical NTP hydrolase)
MEKNMDNQAINEIAQTLEDYRDNVNFKKQFKWLMELMNDVAHVKGWYSPPKSFGEQVVMMHSELSEVIEAYRAQDHDDITKIGHSHPVEFTENGEIVSATPKPEGVAIEFADLVIRVFDTCAEYKIPLLEAILQKTAYNITRKFRHGNKAL